jgi:hypothetical protein
MKEWFYVKNDLS